MDIRKTFCLAAILGLALISTRGVEAQGVVAHRGFHKYDGAVENSVASLLAAVDHDFYGTEFDVQLSDNGTAIIYHDAMMGGLPIQGAPIEEIMDNPASHLANGERVPLLKDFITAAGRAIAQQQSRGRVTRLFYELKVDSHEPFKVKAAVDQALEMIVQHHLEKNVYFISFNLDVCRQLAERMPGVAVAYLGGDMAPSDLAAFNINGIDYAYKTLLAHPEWVEQAHKLGMTVNVWTVNDADTARKMQALGVDLITTDKPLDMAEWIAPADK